MPNEGGLDTETLLPLALVAGAGLLIWTMSKKGEMPPTGYCVPEVIVNRLVSIPGLTNMHPTAICRYYAAREDQQAYFWTLSDDLKVMLMQCDAAQAMWFTCVFCAS